MSPTTVRPPMPEVASPTSDEPAKVLVVDDDPITLTMIEDALAEHFEVCTADDGERALELSCEKRFDCVLADHFMAGMTGVELLSALHERAPDVMRILMTASDDSRVFTAAVNRAQVHRLLVKPLRWPELPSVVRGLVREGRVATHNQQLLAELARSNARLEAEVAQRTRELQAAVRQLEELALRDGLTGVYNRRHFQDALRAEVARARRHGHHFGLVFMDVDHFKHYNDRNGHPAGDRLLQQLAQLLTSGPHGTRAMGTRASDLVARYGGEEFTMILPETGIEGARVKAERVRAIVAKHAFEHARAQPLGCVSVSVGVASFPTHGDTPEALLDVADTELYRAKAGGRNRVCVAGGD